MKKIVYNKYCPKRNKKNNNLHMKQRTNAELRAMFMDQILKIVISKS